MSDKKKSGNPIVLPERFSTLFNVETPVATFNGERFGVGIRDGKGTTRDVVAARACLDAGYTVTDAETGKSLE